VHEETKAGAFRVSGIMEYLSQGLRTLSGNKVRTALSMLGIMIGVAAVVAMLALGRGAQDAIQQQLSSLGSNLLVLRTGGIHVGGVAQQAGSTAKLTVEDASEIRTRIGTARRVGPVVNGHAQAVYMNRNWSTNILGGNTDYPAMHTAVPQVGRFFTEEENLMRGRVAVVGATIVRELFAGQNPVGEMMKINKVSFQVIGVLPEKGATGWRDQDDIVVIPVNTAMHRLLGKEYADFIEIEVGNAADMDSTQQAVLDLMISRHRIPPSQQEDAFQVRNMADIQAALSQSSKTMGMLLASIAAISLLVGGIGIMNIMLVSVTERTREIGLRKAIGAKRWDILSQFLAEAVVVSTVGGGFGIALGWLITVVLSKVAGWTTTISPANVLLAFGFSASIGIIFGIYPARKASILHPIDALRYE
jgi:macrolide transport system ATP-binding/permease protein